jgi:LmbE family N-acetylglucosaminyl deacetylase
MGSLEKRSERPGKVDLFVKTFTFPLDKDVPATVLCLGAHSDDLEIGCGGAILYLTRTNPNLTVHWIVFSGSGQRGVEARQSADQFLAGAGSKQIIVKEYRDGFFPYTGGQIKDEFESLKKTISPDLIFTHCRHDLHQDHHLINELTWNTFRDHLILEYETPKYDGDLGAPNLFVPLDDDIVRQKIGILLSVFRSQAGKHWFSDDLFRSLMRLRGMECAHRGYAEAFHVRKLMVK